jgi:hypothetical protein
MNLTNMGSQPGVRDYSIPNSLVNGLPREMNNQKMTQYNDLRRVGLTQPHILDLMAVHFQERKGYLTTLLTYLDKTWNPNAAAMRKKDGKQTMRDMVFAKNMKLIGNHEFAWAGKAPQCSLYKIVNNVSATSDGQVGFGTDEFVITVNKPVVDKDDVFILNDQRKQLIVSQPPVRNLDGTATCRVRQLFTKQDASHIANVGVDVTMLQKGCELAIQYNIKPEASDFGSRAEWHFNDWYRNYMTTQRYEWDMTGLAMHTKVDPKVWVTYTSADGNQYPYWTTQSHIRMMQLMSERRENALFMGLPYLDLNGQHVVDSMNRTYWGGTGFYWQCNRRLRRSFNNLNSFKIFDDLLFDAGRDTGSKPVLFAMMGRRAKAAFSKICLNEFRYSPHVVYFTGGGEMMTAPSGEKIQGIKSDFTYYETTHGIFIVGEFDDMSRKNLPSYTFPDGTLESDWRCLIVNIADELDLKGGMGNINLVSMTGRQNVVGVLPGMAQPGRDNFVATPIDAHKEMILDMHGIAVGNPNCMMELSRQRPVVLS